MKKFAALKKELHQTADFRNGFFDCMIKEKREIKKQDYCIQATISNNLFYFSF